MTPANKQVKSGSLYRQTGSGFWWAKYYIPGRSKPIRESTKETDWAAAQNYLRGRLGDAARGKFAGLEPDRILVSSLLDRVEEDYIANGRRSTEALVCRMKHLRPVFGALRAAAVGTRQVDAYKALRRKEGAKNATINREMEVLRRAFLIGYQDEPQLVLRPLRIVKLKEDNIREGVLAHEDYVRLRNASPEPYKTLLVCGYHLGTRLGELSKLQWSEVDFDRGLIELRRYNTKTKKPRVLPIYGDMKEFLLLARAARDQHHPSCPWVFHIKGRGHFRLDAKVWHRRATKMGLKGLLFHDLRRTALTNMIEAGIPEKEAMEISGHTTRKTFERYHIVRTDRLAQVGQKMEQYFTQFTPAAESQPSVDKIQIQ
jgi:integrase